MSAVWLGLVALRSAKFVLTPGTGWSNPLLPWFARVALLLEGALAILPLAVFLTVLVALAVPANDGRFRRVRAVAGGALLTGVAFLYVTSWAAFANVGQFVDVQSWRFWVANPMQNLAYVREMQPRALWIVPLEVAGMLLVLTLCTFVARRVPRTGRRVLRAAAAGTLWVAIAAVLGITAWTRTDHTQRLDPGTGTSWDALGLYSAVRRDKTGPISHLAATMLDAVRSDEAAGPSPGFAVVYPPVGDFDDSAPGRPLARRPNVVVILMESMRADRLLGNRDGRAIMPEVQALARTARVFPRAFAVATHTNYASPAVLSSQYPMRSTGYFTYPAQIRFPHRFLYDHLKRAGYRTAFFSSDDEHWGGKLNYIDTTSLDRFFHAESFSGPTYRPRGSKVQGAWLALRHAGLPDDRITVSLASQWVDSVASTPFFLYVALQNSHSPYEYPSDFPAPFGRPEGSRAAVTFTGVSADSLRSARDAYDNSLAYDDSQLARLFATLKAHGVWDNTIIVLTSDHAEAFNEHGFGVHGNALYDEQVRVPLLVRAPGLAAGIDTTLASTVDIAPTVLALLGLPPDAAFEGTSLLTQEPHRTVYSVVQSGIVDQYGMVRGNWKLFFDRGSRRFSLFDLSVDPDERHNLADSLPAQRRAMAAQLDTWRWAHLHYYDTALLRARFFAPHLVPCPTCTTPGAPASASVTATPGHARPDGT